MNVIIFMRVKKKYFVIFVNLLSFYYFCFIFLYGLVEILRNLVLISVGMIILFLVFIEFISVLGYRSKRLFNGVLGSNFLDGMRF